jgi:hypothetical protein
LWRRDLTRKGLQAYLKGDYKIPEAPLEVLNILSEDKRNDIWLLSGLPVKDVLDRVAEKVVNIGIVLVFFSSQSPFLTMSVVLRTVALLKRNLEGTLILENG